MKWNLDSSHSSIEFTVKHMALTSVRGRFTEFTGEGHTNAAGVLERVRVVIKAASLNTAEEQRDAHLRSADFFDTDKYPTIIYESTEIKLVSPDRYEMTGDLTMHGVTRPLSMVFTTTNPVRGMAGEVRVGGQSQGTLRRKDWGLVWNHVLEFGGVVVSDEVWFTVTVQSVPEATPHYRVRWALASPDDRYQFTVRYGARRLQGELDNVSGWFDILDGRPSALQVEFPLSGLHLPLGQLPRAAVSLLTRGMNASLSVQHFESDKPGVHLAEGTLSVGSARVPVTLEIENINLPGGSSTTLTSRVVVTLSQPALRQLGEGSGLNIGSAGQEGLQATLWFMAKTRQELTEMAVS